MEAILGRRTRAGLVTLVAAVFDDVRVAGFVRMDAGYELVTFGCRAHARVVLERPAVLDAADVVGPSPALS